MPKFNYITPIGDDFIIPISFFQADGVTPADISGCAIALLLKPLEWSADSDPSVITVAGTITNPTGGLAQVSIAHGVSAGYSGTYYYKIKLTTGPGVVVSIAYGVITFTSKGSTQSASALNSLNVNLGTGVTVAGGGGNYFTWAQIATTSQALISGNAYIPTSASLTTFTLPASASVGDHFIISGKGAGGWKLAQNSGQSIAIGLYNTTTGVAGYLASTVATDVIELVCVGTNQFQVVSSYGNITVN